MLEENNNIIIVDDDPKDVERIANVFLNYGIGCRTFVYDSLDVIDKPLENVKLAFFDICLLTSGNDTEQFAILCDALKSYVSCNNKAFVLVFWTSKPEMIESLKEYINDREKNSVPKPIVIKCIDKHKFIEKQSALMQTLSDLMSDPIVRCLFSFESELKNAANQSLYDVLKFIEFPDSWGANEQYINNIKEVFAKIATETFGAQRGRQNPDLAIKEAFAPLFHHYLCNNDDKVWKDLFEDMKIDKVKEFPDTTIVAKLNTLFHVDTSEKENDSRGSVRCIEREDRGYAESFKSQIGYTPNEWLHSILFKNAKINGDALEIVDLEYSAACDYSNGKKRTHRYMFGAIIPVEVAAQLEKVNLGDAICYVPFKFMYEEKECILLLHFNYSINEEGTCPVKLLGDRLFSLKSEVMNWICDRHANHISRIGITSFR